MIAHIKYAQAAIKYIATLKKLTSLQSTERSARAGTAALCVAVLVGCASAPLPVYKPAPLPAPAPAPAPVVIYTPPPPPPAPVAIAKPQLPLVSSWAEYRRRAAQMIMAANSAGTFGGKLPDPLYGIASVSMELNADGSLKVLDMMRASKVSPEINQMSLDAVQRVGNFGSVANLPYPWQFNETFFYNDNKKFQLVTIVENR